MYRRILACAVAAFLIGGLTAALRHRSDTAAAVHAIPLDLRVTAPPTPLDLSVEARTDANPPQTADAAPLDIIAPEAQPIEAGALGPEWTSAPLPTTDLASVIHAMQAIDVDPVDPDLAVLADGSTTESHGSLQSSSIPITAIAASSTADLYRDLQNLGLIDPVVSETTVSGRLASSQIGAAGQLSSIRYIRTQWVTHSATPAAQGDRAMRSDLGRKKYNVTGKGARVGLISDSFDCLGGYENDVAAGELPEGVEVLRAGDCEDGTDEGRAMAQIVHDVAPDAILKFNSAGLSPEAMARSISELLRSGVDVIVDDVGFANEPWFQSGVITRAIDAASAMGVAYVAAAGNYGHASYESSFDDAGPVSSEAPESRLHDFDPGPRVDRLQRVTVAPSSAVALDLQWSDNFKPQNPQGPAPATDLALLAFTSSGDLDAISPGRNLASGEPFDRMVLVNRSDEAKHMDLAVAVVRGHLPSYFKWSLSRHIGLGAIRIDEHATSGATTLGHRQAPNVISVGASNFEDTPVYGQRPPILRSYSSRGSTPILLDKNGELLPKALKYAKPDLVAPDGVNTTVEMGPDSSHDADKQSNFAGTSAAAPHAAGVAALLLEKDPKASPRDICNAMASTATDMGAKGYDYDTGSGLIAADRALGALKIGITGACGTAPLELPIVIPQLDLEPAASNEPTPSQIVTPSMPPLPSPTPIPPSPHIFVDQREVFAGSPIDVRGWHLPRNTRFGIALDGERVLGFAETKPTGSLSATVTVPKSMPLGKYLVTATSASNYRLTAAQPVFVYAEGPDFQALPPGQVVPQRDMTIAPFVVLALFLVALLFLRLWRWSSR
jgi:hypothetical protein